MQDSLDRPYFDPIETAPRAEIEALQERRLLAQIAYVAERSALVREVWAAAGVRADEIRSVPDFKARAPFIDKDRQRAFRDRTGDPFGGVVCVPATEISLVGSSSGTTGDPTLFAERYTDPGCWVWSPREIWHMGVRPGDYVALLDSVLRSVGHLYFHDYGTIPLFMDHDAGELPRFVQWSLEYRPKCMFMLSSVLIYGLAKLEAEQGVDLKDVFSSYRAVIYGGEPMGRQSRALMERWNVPVFQLTSLGDCGTGWECQARDGFHAWEDLVLFEVLEPEGDRPVPDGGRGEMVITSLCDRTDPLIRFRSGDLVRWTREPCACGRTHVRYWILGRVGDETRVKGKSVMPMDVWGAIESVPETAAGLFQIIRPQRELEVLKLRVGHERTDDPPGLIRRVADAVEAATGLRPEIELMPNAEIIKFGPYHKIPRTARQ